MLYMITERFKSGLDPVADRFRNEGRLIPEGLNYCASWMADDGSVCFQLMETEDAATLEQWTQAWSDLVSFEVCPVAASAEFWENRKGIQGR